MELINWSLSAIDNIVSLRKGLPGEPVCPDRTFDVGYLHNAWNSWRVVCLEALSVEDVEELFIFGSMLVGFLFLGLGIALTYQKICKTAAFKFTQLLSEELYRDISARTVEAQRRLDTIGGQTGELL